MKHLSVTSSCDDNYVNYLIPLIASILDNSPNSIIEFNLIYETLNDENIKNIKLKFKNKLKLNFVKVDKKILEDVLLEAYYKVSYEAYTRILIPNLLKDIDKTIYLDPDTIVLKDLNLLNDINLEKYEIGAVVDFNPNSVNIFKEAMKLKNAKGYFNSGVMIMNLKKLREDNFPQKALDLIRSSSKNYKFFDQDILNYFFSNKFLKLDPRWNTQLYIELNSSNFEHTSLSKEEFENCIRDPYIVHYTIIKPDKLNYFFKHKNIYKKYLELAGIKFATRKTSISEIFWTLTELIFFKFINLFKPQIRNKILYLTRTVVIRIISSIKK